MAFARLGTTFQKVLLLALVLTTHNLACGQTNGADYEWSPERPTAQLPNEPSPQRFGSGATLPESPLPLGAAAWDASPAAPRNRALEIVQRRDETAVRRYRQGFFQRLQFAGGWIPEGGVDGLGIDSFKTSLTVAIPLGSFENLLLVTPAFEVEALRPATSLVLPDYLYNTGVDLMWRKQFNDRWGTMLAVRPGIASDFQTSGDAFRLTGRALVTWQWVPERLALLFGVVYLDRDDLPILPGIGLIWTPNPDWRLDLIFPRPKLARRLVFLPQQREDWIYVSGALGGRTWAIDNDAAGPDQLTLRDYRILAGWERVREGGSGLFIEAGLVFGRELEFDVAPLDKSFADAIVIQAGLTF